MTEKQKVVSYVQLTGSTTICVAVQEDASVQEDAVSSSSLLVTQAGFNLNKRVLIPTRFSPG